MDEFVDSVLERIQIDGFDETARLGLRTLLESFISQTADGHWELDVKNDEERESSFNTNLKELLGAIAGERKEYSFDDIFHSKYRPGVRFGGGVESIAYTHKDRADRVYIVPNDFKRTDLTKYISPFIVHLIIYVYFRDIKKLPNDQNPVVEIEQIDVLNVKEGLRPLILEEYGGKTFSGIMKDAVVDNFHDYFCSFLYTIKNFRGDLSLNHTDLHVGNICFKDTLHVVEQDGKEYVLPVCKLIDLGFVCSYNGGRDLTLHCNDEEEDIFQFLSFYCVTMVDNLTQNKENVVEDPVTYVLKLLIPTIEVGKHGFEKMFPTLLTAMKFSVGLSKRDKEHFVTMAQNMRAFVRFILKKPELYEKLKEEIKLDRLLKICFENYSMRGAGKGILRKVFPNL